MSFQNIVKSAPNLCDNRNFLLKDAFFGACFGQNLCGFVFIATLEKKNLSEEGWWQVEDPTVKTHSDRGQDCEEGV
jgi:hypothetical protein